MEQKQELQGSGPYFQLFGVRSKDRRAADAGTIPYPVEVTPTGALKMSLEALDRKPIANAVLGTGSTVVFTAQSVWKNIMILALNVDGAINQTFELHHRINGAAVADANMIFPKATSLVAGDGLTLDGIGLLKGDIISGLCSTANKVSIYLYGIPG